MGRFSSASNSFAARSSTSRSNDNAASNLHFLADGIVGLVAGLHLYFLILEMFLWTHPIGRRAIGLSPEFAAASKKLAANQGLYNGFLAVGLIWGLWAGTEGEGGENIGTEG